MQRDGETWRQMEGNVCAGVVVGSGDDQGGEVERSLHEEKSEQEVWSGGKNII